MEIAFLLLAILIVVSVLALRFNQDELDTPFSKKPQLFNTAERQFLNMIEAAVANEFRVICRVRLSDLVSLRKNIKGNTGKSAIVKAGSKQIDYVLCDKNDMTPVMAIDLVYGSGAHGHNTQRDLFVNSALEAASIPHVRIKAKPGYSVDEIKECIEAKLIPLRRRQGKVPYSGVSVRKSVIQTKSRPTRPLNNNRNVPKNQVAA